MAGAFLTSCFCCLFWWIRPNYRFHINVQYARQKKIVGTQHKLSDQKAAACVLRISGSLLLLLLLGHQPTITALLNYSHSLYRFCVSKWVNPSIQSNIQQISFYSPKLSGWERKARSATTVVSNREAIVGLGHPVTIGNHSSAEISMTKLPRHLKIWPFVRNT